MALALVQAPPRRRQHPPGSSDEWFTPWSLFRPLDEEFRFTVDVAATRENTKCDRYYSRAKSGLLRSWLGERAWCNPPYSDITPWVSKASWEVQRGGCLLVVQLLPSRTDVAWWHDYVEPARTSGHVELRFLRGRVRFGWPGNPDAKGARGGGKFPSVLVIWRAR